MSNKMHHNNGNGDIARNSYDFEAMIPSLANVMRLQSQDQNLSLYFHTKHSISGSEKHSS